MVLIPVCADQCCSVFPNEWNMIDNLGLHVWFEFQKNNRAFPDPERADVCISDLTSNKSLTIVHIIIHKNILEPALWLHGDFLIRKQGYEAN